MNLPAHWVKVPLSEVIITRKGKKPNILLTKPFPSSVPYLDIESVEKNIETQFCDTYSALLADDNDIFIVADGSRSGWVARGKKGAVASTIICITSFIDRDYLFYFLKLNFEYFNKNTTGNSIPHLNLNLFYSLEIPLPPLEEQKKIVIELQKELEKHENDLENAKKEIERMKQYKESVINDAIKTKNINDYRCYKINDLTTFIGSGGTPLGGSINYNDKGIMFLRSQNIHTEELYLDDVIYITQDLHTKMKRSHVYPNDVLLNITGSSIGRCAVVPSSIDTANVNQHVCILRTNDKILPHYLSLYINSQVGQQIIRKLQHGGTREALNYEQIRSIEISLPSIERQAEILKEIALNLNETMNFNSKNNFKDLLMEQNRLMCSILQIAFTKPSKEIPAKNVDTLLEIIKKEKDETQAKFKLLQQSNLKINAEMRKKIAQQPALGLKEVMKNDATTTLAKDVWLASMYKDSIDDFYTAANHESKNGGISWHLEKKDTSTPESIILLNL